MPGQYLFEVTVSDSRGFTEVYGTVPLTLYDVGGTLPTNNPPTAIPQAVSAAPASVTPITVTGSDPEGYALVFTVTSQPVNGTLTGTAPDLTYTSDGGYTGSDSFTFQVMDSEGQTSSATVSISVSGAGIELYAYDGFDYPPGSNILTPLNGGTGFATAWARAEEGSNDSITVTTGPPGTGSTNAAPATPGSLDGVFNNAAVTTSPTGSGNRYIDGASGDDRITALRKLNQSAGALAGDDKVLWASVIWTMNGSSYGRQVGFALGTDGLRNRSQNVSTNTSWGGTGAGVAMGVGGAISSQAVTPTIWNGGNQVTRTTTGAKSLSTTQDNIVILKYVFADGSDPDTVSAWAFAEGDTITEAIFNGNAVSAQSVVDQNTLNILSFGQSQHDREAIDEIRIGNSFAAVIGVQGAPPDTTPPTLAAADIVDDRAGEPVVQNTPVSYSVTFSEEMNPATVDATDFSNAGSASITINSIIHPLHGVFVIQVTPTTAGSLQLQVDSGAVLTDAAGTPLDTAAAIADDTVITVNPLIVPVPNVTGVPQASAESSIISAGLAVGIVTSQYHATAPAGNVIGQSPAAGTSVSLGSPVDMVVSLGPSDGRDFPLADIPVSGTFTGTQSDTLVSDDIYQALTEEKTGGSPPSRVSFMEHKWLFEVEGGGTVTFHVEAYHTDNSENDHFTFAYSTTGPDGTYQDMLTVIKTTDDDVSQTFVMPAGISGTVHVRVIDTDRSVGNGSQDTLSIDEMYFLSASGPVMTTVPNVTGLAQATAEADIVAANLIVGTVTSQNSESVLAGDVLSQNPAGATSIAEGSGVDLVVSLGPVMTTVPNVTGLAQATAESNLVAANLVVGTVTSQNSGTVAAGDVISQNPTGGTSLAEGSAVDLLVSLGPVMTTAPNVTGLAQTTAESNLVAANLVVGTVTTQNSGTVAAGDVISQNPTGGTSLAEGSAVDLVVSLGPVPDYDAWQTQYPAADLADRAADFDGDGVSNGEERLWGLDPTLASPVTPILEAPGPAGIFRYTRRDTARTGATYSIWTSPSLLPDSWTEDTEAGQVAGDPDANHVETVTVTLSPGRLGGARLFVLVRVTE